MSANRSLAALLCVSFSGCSFAIGDRPTTPRRAPAIVDAAAAAGLGYAAYSMHCHEDANTWCFSSLEWDVKGVLFLTAAVFAASSLYGWTRPAPPPPTAPARNPDGPPDVTLSATERTELACNASRRLGMPDGRVVTSCGGE
jgi:hypothetical protein